MIATILHLHRHKSSFPETDFEGLPTAMKGTQDAPLVENTVHSPLTGKQDGDQRNPGTDPDSATEALCCCGNGANCMVFRISARPRAQGSWHSSAWASMSGRVLKRTLLNVEKS